MRNALRCGDAGEFSSCYRQKWALIFLDFMQRYNLEAVFTRLGIVLYLVLRAAMVYSARLSTVMAFSLSGQSATADPRLKRRLGTEKAIPGLQ
jgi:hypothetical protein